MREPQEGDEVKGNDAPELSSRPLSKEEDSAANCTARGRKGKESERDERDGRGGGRRTHLKRVSSQKNPRPRVKGGWEEERKTPTTL